MKNAFTLFLSAMIGLGIISIVHYNKADAGSSVQSLTTDSSGKIIANQRDGTATEVISKDASGNVGFSGDLNVIGDLNVTGNSDLTGSTQVIGPDAVTSALNVSNTGVGSGEGLFFGGSSNAGAIGFMAQSDGTAAFNNPIGFKMTHTEGFVLHTIGDRFIILGKNGSEGNAFASTDAFFDLDVSGGGIQLIVRDDGDCDSNLTGGNVCSGTWTATYNHASGGSAVFNHQRSYFSRIGDIVNFTTITDYNPSGISAPSTVTVDITTLPFSGTFADSLRASGTINSIQQDLHIGTNACRSLASSTVIRCVFHRSDEANIEIRINGQYEIP